MIDLYCNHLVRKVDWGGGPTKIISFGLSSVGYDVRLSREFRIFTPSTGKLTCIDPKAIDEEAMVEFEGDVAIIPPNSFVLARTLEYFRMPDTITGLVTNKSTYARCGIVSPSTVLEPGWEGHVTLEFSNTTPLPAKLYAGEGAVQVLFFSSNNPDTTYRSRNGKYQGQMGITLPIV
jgi:dCTP deaminase